MREVYRIVKEVYAEDPLSGSGAELYGGRWNRAGEAAVYCSAHRSLALLEVLVHFQSLALLPEDRVLITISLPESEVRMIQNSDLPAGWKNYEINENTTTVFDQLCRKKGLLAVAVPSVVVPEEYNYIIDPGHPGMTDVEVMKRDGVKIDHRLLR